MTASASTPRERRRRRLAIALTPLIDVVFILLVFFMLASSFLDLRSVRLVGAAADGGGGAVAGALLVEVRPQGFRFAGEPLDADALTARLAERLEASPGRRVLLKPAEGASVQRTVAALDLLAELGAADVSLVGGR
jgi:biopolymer transport protein ExbD